MSEIKEMLDLIKADFDGRINDVRDRYFISKEGLSTFIDSKGEIHFSVNIDLLKSA